MKKLLALLMAVAVTFQLVTPVFADTEGTEETTAPTEAVVETEAPTEAPAEETTVPTEETAAPTEETSAPTEATEETEEATEETVEDIALFADNGDVIASGGCGENLTWVLTGDLLRRIPKRRILPYNDTLEWIPGAGDCCRSGIWRNQYRPVCLRRLQQPDRCDNSGGCNQHWQPYLLRM